MYKSYSVIEYDLATGDTKKIELDKDLLVSNRMLIYSCLTTYKNKVYLVNSTNCYVATIKDDTIKKFCDFPNDYSLLYDLHRNICRPFYNINVWDRGIQFFPVGANMMIKVDVEQKRAYGLKVVVDENWIHNEYANEYFSDCMNNSVKERVTVYENEWAGLEMFINNLLK